MKIDLTQDSLAVYEALASSVRLNIIKLLSISSMNIKELAAALSLSSAVLSMHINKLEKAGIVKSNRVPGDLGIQKLCSLAIDNLEIEFPKKLETIRNFHEFNVPVGHYSDFEVFPTCGLATSEKVIGLFDDPRYFADSERVNAKILWFTKGYVEYKIPNYLLKNQEPQELEISMEISSEAPGTNDNWPSDISFIINGTYTGKWTSPGDFGSIRGKFTPEWWHNDVNQFGLLKRLSINSTGTYIDGTRISDVTLKELDIRQKYITLKIAILEESKNIGGITLFGRNFGNYNQDIVYRLYYK
jgi:predicted transcriptional regulator